MRRILGCVVTVLLLVPLCAHHVRAGTAEEATVRDLYAKYDAAWNQADVKTLSMFWAAEAFHVEPDGRVIKGRAALGQDFTRRFAAEWKGTHSQQTVEAVQFIKPDVALVDAAYEVTGAHDAEGKPLPPLRGRYLDVWVKKAGKWQIVADRPVAALERAK